MLKSIITILFSLACIFSHAQENIPTTFEQGNRPIYIGMEYGLETKGQEDIRSMGLKLEFAHFHRVRFATTIESKMRWYKGVRSDIENNTLAFGLGYAIKYYFLEKSKFNYFVDCGFGAIYALDRFPSRGTHLNGQYYFGVGSYYHSAGRIKPHLSIRYFHSSNGRGFVMDNPAFDGLFLTIGIIL